MNNKRQFQFRLKSTHNYNSTKNPSTSESSNEAKNPALLVEFLSDSGEWQAQQPSLSTPGFRLYLLSLLLCQHFYLVANAEERMLPLRQVHGSFKVTTSNDWIIDTVAGEFELELELDLNITETAISSGYSNELKYIEERMKLCPVSKNLAPTVLKTIKLKLSPAAVQH